MASDRSPASCEVSLFGKLRARADFVRERCAGPAAQELDQWLVRAVEQLSLAKAKLPASGVRYAYASARAQKVVVGALAPSSDQVGREFPLTIFCTLPFEAVEGRLAALPFACDGFLTEAERLLAELAGSTSAAPIGTRLDALRGPSSNELADAHRHCERGLHESGALPFIERLFDRPDLGMHCYAFFTFLTATASMRDPAIQQSAVVLDCPTRVELDRLLWMALADRLLRGQNAMASCFWRDPPESRLLLSLGPTAPEILRVLSDPTQTSARLWPLTTDRSAAIERARAALPQALVELDGAMTADRMLSLVEERARTAAHP